MPRQLVILGTASQVPTRERNHNGYLLRWDGLGLLFDPGEGAQRQLLHAGGRSSAITHIAITHRHGDHLLGLPGILARMALDGRQTPITLIHPADATETIDHLLAVVGIDPYEDVVRHVLPDASSSRMDLDDDTTLEAVPLDHRVPALGYRIVEAPRLQVNADRLAALQLAGPPVGRLLREGALQHRGRTVTVDEVAEERPGQSMGFVMDTRLCDGIQVVLDAVDLAVVEATFQKGDEDLAARYGHLTAEQAGSCAARAGARRLVLTHFSRRYRDGEGFALEARRHHDDVIAAADLDRIDVPARASSTTGARP